MRDVQSWDVKSVPRSEVMCSDTPKQQIHPDRRASAQEYINDLVEDGAHNNVAGISGGQKRSIRSQKTQGSCSCVIFWK